MLFHHASLTTFHFNNITHTPSISWNFRVNFHFCGSLNYLETCFHHRRVIFMMLMFCYCSVICCESVRRGMKIQRAKAPIYQGFSEVFFFEFFSQSYTWISYYLFSHSTAFPIWFDSKEIFPFWNFIYFDEIAEKREMWQICWCSSSFTSSLDKLNFWSRCSFF